MINFGKRQYCGMLKALNYNRAHPRLLDYGFYDVGPGPFTGKPDSYERSRINTYNRINCKLDLSVRMYKVGYYDIR